MGPRGEIEQGLIDAIDACAITGAGAVFRVHGEAGIGKTTMLSTASEAASGRGLAVWTAAATEIEQTSPHGVIDALRDRGGERFLAEEPAPIPQHHDAGGQLRRHQGPNGQPLDPAASRFPLLERAIEAAEAHGQQPMLVIIDDAQWMDPASVTVVAAIAEVALTHPVVLIVAHREAPASDSMAELIAKLDMLAAHDVEIPPLTDDEMLSLLTKLCGGSPGETLVGRAMGAAGNPFLLSQFVNGLLTEGALETDGRRVDVGPHEVPQSLRQGVARQLASLGDDAALVIRACSVQGLKVDIASLAAMLDRTAISLVAPVEEACAAGLLEDADDALGFRHDLVRAAVYEQMPIAIRQATHLDLAGVLARRGASAAVVGTHLVLGSDVADPMVIERLRRAADETAAIDPSAALAFLDRARSLAGIEVETRKVIERARLDALTAAGRTAEAEAVAHWLLEVSSGSESVEILARLGGLATIAGDGARAMRYLDDARVAATGDDERSRVVAMACMTSAINGDYDRAHELATEAVEVGRRANDPIGQSSGLALLARMSTYGNVVDEGLRLGASAVATADADTTGTAHSYVPSLHLGMTAFDADQLELATNMVDHGNRLAATYGMAWSLPLYGTLAAAVHYRRGELDAAQAEASAAVALAEQTNSRQALAWAHAVVALAATDQGDLAQARHSADAATACWLSGSSPLGVDHIVLAQARVGVCEGAVGDSYTELTAAWDLFEQVGLPFCQPLLAVDLACLSRELGDEDQLRRVEAAAVEASRVSGIPALIAVAGWISALAADDREGALSAIERFAATERRLDVARLVASAPVLCGQAQIREAFATFEATGADGCAAFMRARLVRDGSDFAFDQDDAVFDSGGGRWALLTATEREIVQHLADGCTNAQIAQRRGSSRRTIESHLRKVYEKLGIDGRVRLTVAASEYFR